MEPLGRTVVVAFREISLHYLSVAARNQKPGPTLVAIESGPEIGLIVVRGVSYCGPLHLGWSELPAIFRPKLLYLLWQQVLHIFDLSLADTLCQQGEDCTCNLLAIDALVVSERLRDSRQEL